MIRGAIFDMDGTLLDSMCVWEQLCQRYLDKFGVQITQADYAALEAHSQYQVAQYFCEHYPQITETPEQVTYGMDSMIYARYETLAKPRDGIKELLTLLQENGVSMAVATLTARRYAEKALKDHGLLDYFDFMLTIDDIGVSKRDPKIYLEAAHRFGQPPSACMVFEDAPYAVAAARQAGFQVCGIVEPWYAEGEDQLRQSSELLVTHSFSEVMPAVRQRLLAP